MTEEYENEGVPHEREPLPEVMILRDILELQRKLVQLHEYSVKVAELRHGVHMVDQLVFVNSATVQRPQETASKSAAFALAPTSEHSAFECSMEGKQMQVPDVLRSQRNSEEWPGTDLNGELNDLPEYAVASPAAYGESLDLERITPKSGIDMAIFKSKGTASSFSTRSSQKSSLFAGQSRVRPSLNCQGRGSIMLRNFLAIESAGSTPEADTSRPTGSLESVDARKTPDLNTWKTIILEAKRVEMPSEVPRFMWVLFCLFGALPTDALPTRWSNAYQLYLKLLSIAGFVSVVALANFSFWATVALEKPPVAHSIAAVASFIGIPLRHALIQEFGPRGYALSFLKKMSQRGFKWDMLLKSVYAMCCFLVVSITIGSLSHFQTFPVRGHIELGMRQGKIWELISICVFLGSSPIILLWGVVVVVAVWFCFLLATLHAHELLWYGDTLAQIIEDDDADWNPVPALDQVEAIITARLRHASETWVRYVLIFLSALTLALVTILSYLIAVSRVPIWVIVQLGSAMLMMLIILSALGLPLAMVAETFEYDVLRALNRPAVVHHAQRYFGQQFLSHLNNLEWGFRAGGTVVSMRMFMNVLMGIMVSISTAVSQSLFDHLNVQLESLE